MNPAFSALLHDKIRQFRNAYAEASRGAFVDPSTGRLFHAGEFGAYREATLRDFLRCFVPSSLDVGSGFLITSTGTISTQLDVVIHQPSVAPRIETAERQRFFPVEAICGIGEVKSSLSRTALKDALNKLANAKVLADQVPAPVVLRRNPSFAGRTFSRADNVYDQVISFLLCERFDFDISNLAQDVGRLYEPGLEPRHYHNLVISMQDGILLYVDPNKKSMMYPAISGKSLKNRFVAPGSNPDVHFLLFCSYMFLMTTSATILYPDMTRYMPAVVGGQNHDQP